MRAARGRPAARLPLVLPPLVLLLLQGGAAADMAYSEPMRLQSPPESIVKSPFCSRIEAAKVPSSCRRGGPRGARPAGWVLSPDSQQATRPANTQPTPNPLANHRNRC